MAGARAAALAAAPTVPGAARLGRHRSRGCQVVPAAASSRPDPILSHLELLASCLPSRLHVLAVSAARRVEAACISDRWAVTRHWSGSLAKCLRHCMLLSAESCDARHFNTQTTASNLPCTPLLPPTCLSSHQPASHRTNLPLIAPPPNRTLPCTAPHPPTNICSPPWGVERDEGGAPALA